MDGGDVELNTMDGGDIEINTMAGGDVELNTMDGGDIYIGTGVTRTIAVSGFGDERDGTYTNAGRFTVKHPTGETHGTIEASATHRTFTKSGATDTWVAIMKAEVGAATDGWWFIYQVVNDTAFVPVDGHDEPFTPADTFTRETGAYADGSRHPVNDIDDGTPNYHTGMTVAASTTGTNTIVVGSEEGMTAVSIVSGTGGVTVAGQRANVISDPGTVLTTNQSGAFIPLVNVTRAFSLPTPALGLTYTFGLTVALSGATVTIDSTTDGSTSSNLFTGILNNSGESDQIINVGTIAFANTAAAEGDVVKVTCISTTTTSGNPTWFVEAHCSTSNGITFI